MKLQIRITAVLAFVILEMAALADAAQIPEVYPKARDKTGTLTNGKYSADYYSKSQYKIEASNLNDIIATPASRISNEKYLRYLMQSSGEIWATVRNFKDVPNSVLNVGDSLANIAQNFNTSVVHQPINNYVKQFVDRFPLTPGAKTNINKYTTSLTKNSVDSTILLKQINIVRHAAQAASVVLSLATALGLTLRDEAVVNFSKNTKESSSLY